MQAAVVSVLLMAGACGSSGERLPAPRPAVVATVQNGVAAACERLADYPSPAGGNYYHVGPFGCPYYTPVLLMHDNAAYYPGNYAVPYDYREIFDYPWHGPRPLAATPAIEIETAAKPVKPALKKR